MRVSAKNIVYGLLYLAFLALFAWVFWLMIGNNPVKDSNLFLGVEKKSEVDYGTLKVVYPGGGTNFEPTILNPLERAFLVNTYEALVFIDEDFNVVPRLAISWGLLEDRIWVFNLRPNVRFHDESLLDAADVKASLDRALTRKDSELIDLLSTIESVEIVNSLEIKITTKLPDPLLLQKLSKVFILPSEKSKENAVFAFGTGPYRFYFSTDRGTVVLKRYEDYWGELGHFEKVEMFSIADKSARVQMIIDGAADFLSFVPYDAIDLLKSSDFEVLGIPSLEVQFLLFNFDSEVLKNTENRKLIFEVLNHGDLTDKIGGFSRKVSQFVSRGVFGFNQIVEERNAIIDLDNSETSLAGQTLQIHLEQGLDVLGDYVRQELKQRGVNVVVSYLDQESLDKSISERVADIYFLGFKSEFGDSSEFFESVLISGAPYNIGKYRSLEVDFLIESAKNEFDFSRRGQLLKEAMRIVVEEDIAGVPLFEYEIFYGYNPKFIFEPRLDGVFYFDQLIPKE